MSTIAQLKNALRSGNLAPLPVWTYDETSGNGKMETDSNTITATTLIWFPDTAKDGGEGWQGVLTDQGSGPWHLQLTGDDGAAHVFKTTTKPFIPGDGALFTGLAYASGPGGSWSGDYQIAVFQTSTPPLTWKIGPSTDPSAGEVGIGEAVVKFNSNPIFPNFDIGTWLNSALPGSFIVLSGANSYYWASIGDDGFTKNNGGGNFTIGDLVSLSVCQPQFFSSSPRGDLAAGLTGITGGMTGGEPTDRTFATLADAVLRDSGGGYTAPDFTSLDGGAFNTAFPETAAALNTLATMLQTAFAH
jgi:hypothetical protein